jgi:hypothetical protein
MPYRVNIPAAVIQVVRHDRVQAASASCSQAIAWLSVRSSGVSSIPPCTHRHSRNTPSPTRRYSSGGDWIFTMNRWNQASARSPHMRSNTKAHRDKREKNASNASHQRSKIRSSASGGQLTQYWSLNHFTCAAAGSGRTKTPAATSAAPMRGRRRRVRIAGYQGEAAVSETAVEASTGRHSRLQIGRPRTPATFEWALSSVLWTRRIGAGQVLLI